MNRGSAGALRIEEYADAVYLRTPHRRAQPLAVDDRPAVVRELVDQLLADDTLRESRPRTAGFDDPRSLLRVLLTVRPPTPLPESFHAALDRLLEGELHDRGIVDASVLHPLASAGGTDLALWRGDITTLRVDAIVNAANSALLGCFRPMHACIDNAIHCGAGPRLREDCATIIDLQGHEEGTGWAKATRAFDLPARYVLHTVGPIAQGVHNRSNADALARCYEACLDCARELGGVRSIGFCGISTGVFGYPKEPACRTAVQAVRRWLGAHPGSCDLIVFNVFSHEDYERYERVLASPDVDGVVT